MKKITWKDREITIPTKWEEISLKQQIQVSIDNEKYTNEITKKLALISGYCGIPIVEIKRSTPDEVAPLFKHMKFLGEPIPEDPLMEFEFKGEKYYVMQNLVKQEFQDFISLETALSNEENDTYKALPMIIAIMAKRKKDNGETESLDDYDVEERAKLFEDLPISIANGIGVFFYRNVKVFTMASQLFSQPEKVIAMKLLEVESTLSKSVGGGLLHRLLVALLRIYLRFLKRNVKLLWDTTPSKSFIQRWKQTFKKFLSKMRKEKSKNIRK